MALFHGYSSLEEFERQLNPTQWSKRDGVLKEHMAQTIIGKSIDILTPISTSMVRGTPAWLAKKPDENQCRYNRRVV